MKENVGSMDQYFRYAAGMCILSAGVAYENMWGLISVLLIMTALFACRPPFTLLGLATKKSED